MLQPLLWCGVLCVCVLEYCSGHNGGLMITFEMLSNMTREQHRALGEMFWQLGPQASTDFLAGLIRGSRGKDGCLHPDPHVARVFHQIVQDSLGNDCRPKQSQLG